MTAGDVPLEDHDVACGLIEVEGLTVFHLEGPARHEVTRTGRFIWALGISEDGVKVAIPARDGSWAGRGAPLGELGMERLMRNLARQAPRDGDMLRALREAGFFGETPGGLASRLARVLASGTTRGGSFRPEGIAKALDAAGLDAVLARLDAPRVKLYAKGSKEFGLSEEVLAGLMRLPRRPLEALDRFVDARPDLAVIALLTPSLELSGTIDADVRALLSHHGLPVATISRLGIATPPLRPKHLRLMAAVPMDWLPGGDDALGWAALDKVSNLLEAIPDAFDDRSLLAHSKGRWDRFAETLARATGIPPDDPDPDRRLKDACVDLRDIFNRFQDEIIIPALGRRYLDEGHRESEALAVKLIQGNRGLARMLEISRALHATDIPSPGDAAYHEWPARLPDWIDPKSGISVSVLTDSSLLVAEGLKGPDRDGVEGLGHCVGNAAFSTACLGGQIRILSLRKDGRRLSTAEVELSRGLPVVQHRSRRNGVPSPESEATLTAYLALEEVAEAATSSSESISAQSIWELAGEEGDLRENAAKVLDRWRRHLVPEHSSIDVDAIKAFMEGPG